ncbi:MAG: hypothetical protein J6K62_06450 [Clostridia bacterium]|nr:hypothetical protein [Clostridia bacterium]
MKNFEERKAEIFRRSEERRYAAKVRNRLLLFCVPLALCLTTAVIITPSLQQTPPKNEPTTTTAPNAVRQYVEVLAESYYQKYTDLQTYTAVADTLNTIISNAKAENAPQANKTSPSANDAGADIGPEYTITLTDEHGVSTYWLSGNSLLGCEGTDGLCYELSDNEATTLRIMIGSEQRHRSVGRYLKATNGAHLLVINHSVTVLDDVSNLFTPFDDIQTGDKILVFHDEVNETYPASTDAYYVIRLEMGKISDIPDKVIANLSQLGWLNDVSYTPLKPGEGEHRIPFEVQYVRTHSPGDVSHAITVIRSVEELYAYYGEYKAVFDLERRSEVSLDSTIGFLDACDKYDDTYFEDRILLLLRIGTGSGSHRFRITDMLIAENGTLTVDVATLVPEVGTCDMAGWHIFIEPETDINVTDEEHIQINRTTVHLE